MEQVTQEGRGEEEEDEDEEGRGEEEEEEEETLEEGLPSLPPARHPSPSPPTRTPTSTHAHSRPLSVRGSVQRASERETARVYHKRY